jgi:steroid 5-alpha reductase family enzyme
MTMPVILFAALAAVVAMTVAWAIVRRAGDGGWTDVVWTFAVGLIGAGAALAPGPGAVEGRQWIAAALVAAWSLRLGGYLAIRTWNTARHDPRYERLKAEWGGWGLKAWAFLMVQAATILVLVVSVRAAAIRPDDPVGWREAAAAGLLIAAVIGEGLADRQMADFRANPANRGRVADTGLWAWSRHPNYFFEWLAWLAWPLIAMDGSPVGWLSLLAPVMMWWLLNHVSGVPMLEDEMLRSRGDAYRAYQRRVSRFLPLPPRASAPEE